ncbi:hypothetical protein BGZ96_003142 [Linnemannia gamsii]|uniref:FAD-binding domain-containing protein n=1 Tax=Linnemannia gamsii TaxID=64522 RepID=A0ABQ7JJK2_9FUNG|nr:hypothetical protein BGZ96_003142 [Linnemannia gamsii]
MTSSSPQHHHDTDQTGRPKVLIVGAGLAGLTLGMLLHKAGIPFEIYERVAVVKPLGVKVVTIEANDDGVLLRFVNGSEVKGDILVGADGAYSAVRKGLYAKLKDEDKLLPSDDLPLPFTTVSVLARTCPLTPEEFPDIAKEESQFRNFIGTDKMYASSLEDGSFSNSDWGQEAAMTMCEEVKDFPVISGGDKKLTLQYLMDLTPKDQISKVMLEEKVFETWHRS